MNRTFSNLRSGIEALHPAYFALVMSTAIICMAFQMQGFRRISLFLLWFNIMAYAALWAATIWRIWSFPNRVIDDVTNFRRGVGYFTVVAGTCLLGAQFLLVAKHPTVAAVLYLFGFLLWLVLMYGLLTLFCVETNKPPFAHAISGAWLLATVATETVAVLGALLSPHAGGLKDILLFFSSSMFFIGAILYLMIITLLFQRLIFHRITPQGLTSPYWITMGADSITALAGILLFANFDGTRFESFRPVILGLSLLFWATATWWIPLLVLLGVWRYGIKRIPFTYNAGYWGMVYPLGVYTACTWRLAEAIDMPFLKSIPGTLLYVAFLAWLLALIGMLHSNWKNRFRMTAPGSQN